MTAQNGVNTALHDPAGFSLGRLHMGGLVPLSYGGDKALMGGLMRGDIDLMGDLTLIDYIIN